MSLTVNAPFLKFYNLCYLINQSMVAAWALIMVQEKMLVRSSHGQKNADCWPHVTVFQFLIQLKTLACFKFS